MNRLLRFLALSLLALPAYADEVMYITDRVIADLHAEAEAGGALLLRLPTGTRVTVLDENGRYTRVRLPDGTEGWVKASKLQEDRPAQLLLLALSEQQERMAAELTSLRAQLAVLRNERPSRPFADLLESDPPAWVPAVVLLLALLFGFAMGVLWLDRRIRERHGGFRV